MKASSKNDLEISIGVLTRIVDRLETKITTLEVDIRELRQIISSAARVNPTVEDEWPDISNTDDKDKDSDLERML